VALAVLFGACEHEEIGYWPDSEITIGKDIAIAPDDDVGPTDDTVEPTPMTGPACEEDGDCESEFCLSDAFLGTLGVTLNIPGGMCSAFPCFDDSECGVDALCVDGAPFGAEGFSLCLSTCLGMAECRWEEGWDCIAPLPDEPETQVCLPDNVIVALECDDGHCEEASP